MLVEGQRVFAGTREAVWRLLLDPAVVAKTVPGTQSMALVEPGHYRGKMQVGLGPLAAEFDITVVLEDVVEPERYTMRIEGLGRLGYTRGSARVSLATNGAGTILTFRGDLEVGGAIAALGQRLLDSVSGMLASQGLEAMEREVEKRLVSLPPTR